MVPDSIRKRRVCAVKTLGLFFCSVHIVTVVAVAGVLIKHGRADIYSGWVGKRGV